MKKSEINKILVPKNLKEQVIQNSKDIDSINQELENIDIDIVNEKYNELQEKDVELESYINENKDNIEINKGNIQAISQIFTNIGQELYKGNLLGNFPFSVITGTQYTINFGEYVGNNFSINGNSIAILNDIRGFDLTFDIPTGSDLINKTFDLYMSINGNSQGVIHSFKVEEVSTFNTKFSYSGDLVSGDELKFNFRISEGGTAVFPLAPTFYLDFIIYTPEGIHLTSELVDDLETNPSTGHNVRHIQIEEEIEANTEKINKKVDIETIGTNGTGKINIDSAGVPYISFEDNDSQSEGVLTLTSKGLRYLIRDKDTLDNIGYTPIYDWDIPDKAYVDNIEQNLQTQIDNLQPSEDNGIEIIYENNNTAGNLYEREYEIDNENYKIIYILLTSNALNVFFHLSVAVDLLIEDTEIYLADRFTIDGINFDCIVVKSGDKITITSSNYIKKIGVE